MSRGWTYWGVGGAGDGVVGLVRPDLGRVVPLVVDVGRWALDDADAGVARLVVRAARPFARGLPDGGLDHVGQRGGRVPVARAECVNVDEQRHDAVAVHLVGGRVGDRPPGE